MTLVLDRRTLLAAGTFGLGALAMPAGAAVLAARGFTHNVASGEPGQDRVLLWTRYVPPPGAPRRLVYEVSESADFSQIVADGTAEADPERDHCAKVVARGLAPGRWYFFRFRDAAGAASPVGRTRTLPDGPVARVSLGVFSCSNLPFGWFNAYAHAAARTDLDLMVHLGDYLYEYPRGTYPSAAQAMAGRVIDPADEMVSLADYRMRHAAYRVDPDLQRLHQLFPMIAMWDDHESTNDSWENGAQNHQPETEGPWSIRKAAAMRAYREWMPVSDNDFESYRIGDLATILRPETRLTERSEPLRLASVAVDGPDPKAALIRFRDGPWRDASRTMLGIDQERRLAEELRRSTRQGTRWQVLAQQVIMGSVSASPRIAEWGSALADAAGQARLRTGLAAASVGLPSNFDQWDGYPAARDRLLRTALDSDANLIVLTGDSHNAWAFDLDLDGTPAGAEFAGHSVTSPGYESAFRTIPPADVARALVDHNRQLKWADTSRRGYLTLELTPDRATGEWLFLDTVRERSTRIAGTRRMSVVRGSNRLV